MKQIRNIAVIGIANEVQFKNVCEICGDDDSKSYYQWKFQKCPIVYDHKNGDMCSMFNWDEQDYKHCTLYTYEEFLAKFGEKQTDDGFAVTEWASPFASSVRAVTDKLAEMLISKNEKYGNSALEPKRIFSKASSVEQLLVRIDDKLSRIANQSDLEDEDVVTDLLGYLVLLKIAKEKT